MKRFWLALIVAALVAPSAFAQVETSVGTLSVGGKVKWNYMYQAEDDDAIGAGFNQRYGLDGAAIESFATSNVELDINGTVGENVAYIIELQASLTQGLAGVASSPGELNGSNLGIRQAKILITDVLPMTEVTLGTFNLPVGNYQTRATNDWDMIAPPLMNVAPFSNTWDGGMAFNPIGFGWQATGFDFAIVPVDMIELHLCYFNGYHNANANADVDLEKSGLITLNVKPTEGALLGISYLGEGWQEDTNGRGGTEQQNASGWVVNLAYQTDQFEFTADWTEMVAEDYARDADGRSDDLRWTGWQATAGFWVTDSIELLARYDWIDPDTSQNMRTVTGLGRTKLNQYDQLTIITAGVNYLINENAEVSLNYLWITEQGDDIDMDDSTEEAGAGRGEHQALDNDTLLIQVQVWQ